MTLNPVNSGSLITGRDRSQINDSLLFRNSLPLQGQKGRAPVERQSKCKRLFRQTSFLLLVSTLAAAQVSQPKTQGQTNESAPMLTADNIESMTFKPVDESRKRVSAVIKMNKETRKKRDYQKPSQ